MRLADGTHLTYCTNVHPGESWAEVRAALAGPVAAVKRQVSPAAPFGVGLRLSAAAAATLQEPQARAELQALIAEQDLYVFTLNGFPYGSFHRGPVKVRVYEPDWLCEARLTYSNQLASLLAAVLPEGMEGTVSTVPGGFRPALQPDDRGAIARMLVQHAAHLVDLRRRTGKTIVLCLEPEPWCMLETTFEAAAFFEQHLFAREGRAMLGRLSGLADGDAEAALRRHLGVCLDLCHVAVQFEDPATSIERLRAAGVRIGKLQISAGLRLEQPGAAALPLLQRLDDGVYLHQVTAARHDGVEGFLDLTDALSSLTDPEIREWRVHVHVPLFCAGTGPFATTQAVVRQALALHRASPLASHLETETYTWDVLPAGLRGADLVADLARELRWVRQDLGG